MVISGGKIKMAKENKEGYGTHGWIVWCQQIRKFINRIGSLSLQIPEFSTEKMLSQGFQDWEEQLIVFSSADIPLPDTSL